MTEKIKDDRAYINIRENTRKRIDKFINFIEKNYKIKASYDIAISFLLNEFEKNKNNEVK